MVMRVGGLASGMDIDSIVEKLMQAEKAPLNKLYQNKQKYEWQRDAYRDVNTKLKAFDDFLFKDMTLQKDFYKKSVVSTNSAVSATPTTANTGATLSIDSVDQLATAAKVTGQITDLSKRSTTTKLSELDPSLAGQQGQQELKLKVLQKDGSVKDVAIQLTGDSTIKDVVNQLNNNHGLNAFYDEQSGQLAIATEATGKGAELQVDSNGNVVGEGGNSGGTGTTTQFASIYVEDGQNILKALGFNTDSKVLATGQNAVLTINGAQIQRSSNTFDINGFNITLNNTYNGTNNQPISLTTKVDADNMVDKIKKFVETYNGLIDSINTLVKEPRYRDYAPLTDEQKEEMEEKEIEAWEKKAKSGVLRGDNILNSVLNNMRTTMYSSGGGKQDNRAAGENFINTLYEMGITTSGKTSERGKLEIDETKLREAIEKDPEQVFKTFSDTTAGNEGIVQKLRKNIDSTVKEIEKKAGKAGATNQSFQIGRYLNDSEDRIDNWKKKLADIEQRYWKQFTAMEQAISKANTQSSTFFSGQQ